jgi:lipopolysaccharide/colanic/teichoic acid biosynthesis glycosyltransferase
MLRRATDIVVAGVMSLVLLPLVLAVGLIVAVSLGRPVLFRQVRSGTQAQPFTIYKFRTMRPEQFPGEPDGARLGRSGELLRSTSLDELPQLWNVLRGDMSLIGPRPTLPEQVKHYDARQRGRLAVRPGITGWAQVCGRNNLSWPDRIELDLWYLEHRSVLLDLRILGLTALRLFRPSGVTAPGGVNPGFPLPPAGTGEGEQGADRAP